MSTKRRDRFPMDRTRRVKIFIVSGYTMMTAWAKKGYVDSGMQELKNTETISRMLELRKTINQ